MLRSCATSACEPCQGLTAAALSKKWRVPQGSFNGVNRRENASVRFIKDGAQFSKTEKQILLLGFCIALSMILNVFASVFLIEKAAAWATFSIMRGKIYRQRVMRIPRK